MSQNRGLTPKEVEESREKYGENIITPSEKVSLWRLYLEKFQDPMIKILLFALFLSLIIAIIHNDFTELIGVLLAVVLATSIGFWFEWDAARKFDILNALGDESPVRVMREGHVKEVSKREVVVGDIVLLESGEEIPADGEIINCRSLVVDESSLTGEPSIHKTADLAYDKGEGTYPANYLLRGTTVLEGSAVMVVHMVGDDTEIGKVSRLATTQSEEKTPLTRQLDRLAALVSVVGTVFSVSLFIILYVKDILFFHNYSVGKSFMLLSLLLSIMLATSRLWLNIFAQVVSIRKKTEEKTLFPKLKWWFWVVLSVFVFVGLSFIASNLGINPLVLGSWIDIEIVQHILNYFMIAVTLIVVAVPEGLPMSVTLSLALNMRRMLKTNNLVRKMHASETMGAITVICTDKTGTLTRNQMRVSKTDFFVADSNIINEAISVNSTADLDNDKTIGNPTEASLLLWLKDKGVDYMVGRLEADIIDQLTFTTKNKYMATMVSSDLFDGGRVVYVKGAPEIVLGKCSSVNIGGEVKPLNSYISDIEKGLFSEQQKAQRTLAFAYKIVGDTANDCKEEVDKENLVLMGVVSISDPVRPDVKDAISEVYGAGIDVKIVTGDTEVTATEIARQIGVWDNSVDTDRNKITGLEFEALSDEQLFERVGELKIISRARPADKQRLVSILQKRGEVVAVTGDGTNDAPALNFAHVGLSMGSGTSVAKEASDITLIDDSFKSISTAVMWGRSLYKNIQRFLLFQLTINVIALTIVLVGSILGAEVPLTITQMLWVNLIMDTFAAAALASLPPSVSVMRDKPRANSDFIISPEMSRSILVTAIFQLCILMAILYFIVPHFEYVYGMTIFFTSFVMLQFWNMFNAKAFLSGSQSAFSGLSLKSGFVLVAFVIFVGQVIIVSFGGEIFRTTPLSLNHWLLISGLSSIILIAGEVLRLIKRG